MKAIFEIIKKWQSANEETVWVSDTTPREGADYKEMSYAEFAKHHNYAPIETTVPFPRSEKFIIENRPDNLTVKAYLKAPHDKLYIGPMDQPLNVPKVEGLGYGVYYRPSADKPINPGTMVSHYAGELIPLDSSELKDYEYEMSPSTRIDAEPQGNLSRFFAHLPEPLELKFFVMPRSVRNAIAKANLKMQAYEYNGNGALAVIANKSIEPGDMMGFNYNLEYFLVRGTLPVYYDAKGQPLDMSQVTFDKRRYIVFSMFNHQIYHFNQLLSMAADINPDWFPVFQQIQNTILSANANDESYFDFEEKLKVIMPQLEKAYHEQGLAEAFAKTTMGNVRNAHELLVTLKTLLFFNSSDLSSKRIVEQLFAGKFDQFPADHPRAKTHTLDISKPKETTLTETRVSESSMFSAASLSSTTPDLSSTKDHQEKSESRYN